MYPTLVNSLSPSGPLSHAHTHHTTCPPSPHTHTDDSPARNVRSSWRPTDTVGVGAVTPPSLMDLTVPVTRHTAAVSPSPQTPSRPQATTEQRECCTYILLCIHDIVRMLIITVCTLNLCSYTYDMYIYLVLLDVHFCTS